MRAMYLGASRHYRPYLHTSRRTVPQLANASAGSAGRRSSGLHHMVDLFMRLMCDPHATRLERRPGDDPKFNLH